MLKAKRFMMGVVIASVGAVAMSSWAQAPSGGQHGGGDFGGPGLFMGHPGHGAKGLDRMLDSVNATEQQRVQIKQIAQAAAIDLKAQREASRGLQERGLQLFTAPVVDARAVEALRQQKLAQHDQSSKRMTQAMLDISAVLSPEQRVKLAERVKQRAQRMHDHKVRGGASAPTR